jgi:hypothetical protein
VTLEEEWANQNRIRFPLSAIVADAYVVFRARPHDGFEGLVRGAVLPGSFYASPGMQASMSSDSAGLSGAGGTTFDTTDNVLVWSFGLSTSTQCA